MSAHFQPEESLGPPSSRLTGTKSISGATWFDTAKVWPQAGHISDAQRNSLTSNQPFAQGWWAQRRLCNLPNKIITKTPNQRRNLGANSSCRTSWTPLSPQAARVAVLANKPWPQDAMRTWPMQKAPRANAFGDALPGLQSFGRTSWIQPGLSGPFTHSPRWCRP